MSTIGKGMLTAGVIIAALTPMKKAVAQNAEKMNAKPLVGMADELGDRVILTYHGKGKNMRIDDGASEYSVKRRLHGWGFEKAFVMPMKQLKKLIQKADTSEYKGVVTGNELRGIGAEINADSRLAKKILGLQSMSDTRNKAQTYYVITDELNTIARINKDDARMIADDPIISTMIKDSNLGTPYAAVAHLGVKSDKEAVGFALKTNNGQKGNIAKNPLQPTTYFSKELNNKVIIVPTMIKGNKQIPYIAGNDASGVRAFTKTADDKILELEYTKKGFKLKEKKTPIEPEFQNYVNANMNQF